MVSFTKRFVMILPYIFVFIASLYLPTDPDLGWHLKYGEYFFLHHQLLRDNTFSTMMPNYHWINGTWGTDAITYAVFRLGSFWGLTLASATVVTATFFFFAKAGKMNFLSQAILFPLFIYFLSPVNSNSFRGQQLSYLFLGILIFLLSNYKPLSKKLLFIPLLFLVWFNIHEEAFLFLILFGAWIVFVLIKDNLINKNYDKALQKKENLSLIDTFLLSCLVTFINPFGAALWSNALSYIGNPLVKNISEYAPYSVYSWGWWNEIIVSVLLIVYLICIFVKEHSKRHLPIVLMSALLLLVGFSMRRYLWPAYYITLSLLFIPSFHLKKYYDKYAIYIGTIISLAALCIAIAIKLPFSQFTTISWDTYCTLQSVPCSPASAIYLQKHKLPSHLFSYYDWGGWLIWNYPSVKPSIDGRMTEWQDDNGYSAVADYNDYMNDKKSIDKSPYDIVYLPNDQSPLALELSTLIQQKKWKVVYEDDKAGVVVRIHNK